jgi:hypothetical protein
MVVAAIALASPTFALAASEERPSPRPSLPSQKPKTLRTESKREATPRLPCPRAKWHDDPVCFGENDPAALPLPSAQSASGKEPRHGEDVSVNAKAIVNQPSQDPTYFNNPNPRPSTSEVGGGVGLNFHF